MMLQSDGSNFDTQIASREDAIGAYFDKNSAVTGSDISQAYSDSLRDTRKVDNNYMTQALKDSNYGISEAQKTLALAQKKGSASEIQQAKTLLAKAQDANAALKDVLKAMGYDPITGTSTYGSAAGGGSASNVTSAGGGGGGASFGGGGAASLTGSGMTKEQQARKSAYDILYEEFNRYGLAALVEPLKGLVMENVSPSEFSLRLQQTDAYKQRFAANADRIAKGLTALNPAEYLAMEDQYQTIMRNYGLPESYWAKGPLGVQSGFNQLIGNDVSAAELEDRVMTAQNRVINANPEVTKALKAFYPDITNGDILAYALDPSKGLEMIKRKVTAAEIGGAALGQGLTTSAQAAEDLARYGINKQQAEQGYQAIGGLLPRASMLADIYKQDAYTQAVAEAEVFGTGGAVNAAERRKKLSALEQAKFAGSSGAASNALSRDRSMSQMQYRESGAGAF